MDFKTANRAWTDEEKQKISELTKPFSDRVAEFISKELENNDKFGLLEVKKDIGDFKSLIPLMSIDSTLRNLLSL